MPLFFRTTLALLLLTSVGLAESQSPSVILGRPTDRGITVSVFSSHDGEAYVEYGKSPDRWTDRTPTQQLKSGMATEFAIDALEPDTLYYFRIQSSERGSSNPSTRPAGCFHTQRKPGSSFLFEIQGDSHPERPHMFDAALYTQTLRAAANDRPDFYLLLGDDFSVDTLKTVSAETVRAIYLRQRAWLSLVGAPLFLVNGNHEQAALANVDGTPTSVAVLAQNARNSLFPQPTPDRFYSGDAERVEHVGLLRDYYAWTWGDALFVVIDPYWHSRQPVDNVFGSREKKLADMWEITLGEAQYRWLEKTLCDSKAKWKFVFAHHVLGTGRGGVELASLYEWGGHSRNGADEFARRRPGWATPVHQLMVRAGVNIFFQGHDHIFARQQLDGVVYQTLPLPADPGYKLYNNDAFRSGDALPGSGRLRVTVSAAKVTVEYVRSYLPKDATAEHPDGEVAFRYELTSRQQTMEKP
jgi:hypothetical protein